MITKFKKTILVVLRIYLASMGVGSLFILYKTTILVLTEPSLDNWLALSVFTTLTFLTLYAGPFSIRQVIIGDEFIEERILWGLIKWKTGLAEIDGFKNGRGWNKWLGRFKQLIIIKASGASILINEFDQNNISEVKELLLANFKEDRSLKPNYWTTGLKVLAGMLPLLIVLMGALISQKQAYS